MKYFDTQSILLSVALSFLYGCLGGCVYPVAQRLCSFIISVLCQPYLALRSVVARVSGKVRFERSAEERHLQKTRPWLRHMLDFSFFLLFGLGYALLLYITLDGIWRVYTLALLLGGFWLCHRFLGTLTSYALDRLFPYVLRVLAWVLRLLLYPTLWMLYTVASFTVVPLVRKLHERFKRRHSQNIRIKKIKNMSSVFAQETKSPNQKRYSFHPLFIFMQIAKKRQNVFNILDKNNKK